MNSQRNEAEATEKELSELEEFKFFSAEAQLVQLFETHLVEKYGVKPTKIRQAIVNLDEGLLVSVENLSKLILKTESINPIMRDYNLGRGRFVVQIMNKFQDRSNDEEMDRILQAQFNSREGKEKIREIRAGLSLDEGNKRLVEYMENIMPPSTTQALIDRSREKMLQNDEGIARELFNYRDSMEMNARIKKLVAEKESIEAKVIKDAISRARNKIKLEKGKLNANELADYNDDRKMSKFLGKILKKPTHDMEKIVEAARWQLTLDLAYANVKHYANCYNLEEATTRRMSSQRTPKYRNCYANFLHHRQEMNYPPLYRWTVHQVAVRSANRAA